MRGCQEIKIISVENLNAETAKMQRMQRKHGYRLFYLHPQPFTLIFTSVFSVPLWLSAFDLSSYYKRNYM
jgi:hypothetical protein